MIRNYTEEELTDLRKLPKRIANPRARWSKKPARHPLYRQRTYQAKGTAHDGREYHFLIYQRENLHDTLNYSCGIAYLPPGAPRLILARYNGPSHQHGNIHYKTHIHRATAAAIAAGKKPECAAEETTRYRTLEGALACLVNDFSLSGVRANPDQPSLFNGYQS